MLFLNLKICQIILKINKFKIKVRIFCDKHHLPLYTFGGDIVASSAYYLMVMGDRVFAD